MALGESGPTYQGSTPLFFGPGRRSIHAIMDREVAEHGTQMFPEQWQHACLTSNGDSDKARNLFLRFLHKWKMAQLRSFGFDWIKEGGRWHYGYPCGWEPSEGDYVLFIKDAASFGGWTVQVSFEYDRQ